MGVRQMVFTKDAKLSYNEHAKYKWCGLRSTVQLMQDLRVVGTVSCVDLHFEQHINIA